METFSALKKVCKYLKYRFLTIVLVWLMVGQSNAQCGISSETITISSDEDWMQIEGCDSIFGSLLINHWDISDLDEMSNVTWIEGDLVLDENISLLNDNGLNNLQYVGGKLEFNSNFTLQTIGGLQSLTYLGGDLVFDGNITLETVTLIGSIESIQGDLIFRENHVLESIAGLSSVTQVAGEVELSELNLVLDDLSGLSALTEIEGSLTVTLPQCTEVTGLESLQSVGGDLVVFEMPLCANVDGLQSLDEIGGSLMIHDNGSMVQINALSNLLLVEGNVNIHDNPSLFLCCGIQPLLTDGTVGGEVLIEENGMNCGSETEILDACEEGTGGRQTPVCLDIHQDRININCSGSWTLEVGDILGRKILSREGNGSASVDVGTVGLPKYFIFSNEAGAWSGTMMN